MKRNTKKLPSSPAVNTYLSSKLVLICRMPPRWLSCTFSAQNELKCSKSFDPSRGWIRRTPLSIPRRRNLPEWLKEEREKRCRLITAQFRNYSFVSVIALNIYRICYLALEYNIIYNIIIKRTHIITFPFKVTKVASLQVSSGQPTAFHLENSIRQMI